MYKIIVNIFKSPVETKLNNLPIADGAPVIIDAAIIKDKPLPPKISYLFS